MPRATITLDTQRFDLKSLPDGWVELRQLPYSDMLKRQDKAMQYSTQPGKAEAKVDISFANEWTTRFDFQRCIVDHNLEDDNGVKLNFQNPAVLDILDPRVGAEIDGLIANMHTMEDKQSEDFTTAPSSFSTDSPIPLKTDTGSKE